MKLKKILGVSTTLGLATLALASCGKGGLDNDLEKAYGYSISSSFKAPDTLELPDDFDIDTATDAEVYDIFYGTFEDEKILAENSANPADRYYHYAKAEAYLLSEALFVPGTTQGGRYGMSRVGIGSAPYALWGTDSDKLKYLAVATEFIKTADRNKMKAKYDAAKKEAADYSTWSDGSHKTNYNAVEELKALKYTISRTYKAALGTFPRTFDLTNTYRQSDSQILCNLSDYLVQYDVAGNIVPALAESWTKSADGLTYTFKIRQNAKWTDAAGQEYGTVTAQDFVFGMSVAFTNGMTDYMFGPIAGYAEACEDGDFSHMQVSAKDDYTLEIKLAEKTDYFLTYLTYNPYTPIKESYFNSKGDSYGTTYTDILYCGPFVITEFADKSSLKMIKNENYYDKDNVTLDQVIYSYEDGSNEAAAYERLKDGTYASLSLSEAKIEMAKNDKLFKKYAFVGGTDSATTYYGGFNLNRKSYINVRGDESSKSTKTDDQKAATRKAMLNSNFRRAIMAGFNKALYNQASTGVECALNNLRNTYVPGNFVSLPSAAGGYSAGTTYGEMVLGELKKLGSPVKDLSDGVNSYFQPAAAKVYIEKAWEELGLKDDDKIYVDYPVEADDDINVASGQAVKSSIESATDGKIVINIINCADYYTYIYSNYYVDDASEMDYDFDFSSGWGPDYGDPATYIDTFGPDGDMIRLSGINQHNSTK